MAFKLQKADPIMDEKELAEGVANGFKANEPFATIFKDVSEEEYIEKLLPVIRGRLNGPGKETFKIVDPSTNQIVSFFTVQHPYTLTEEEKFEQQRRAQILPDFPAGTNIPLFIATFALLGRIRADHGYNHEVDYMGAIVGTRPECQGQGYATRLAKNAFTFADQTGKKWYAACWPSSTPMYKKLGFQLVKEEILDMGPYGGKGTVVLSLLTREVQPSN